jgi:hypothetical protein
MSDREFQAILIRLLEDIGESIARAEESIRKIADAAEADQEGKFLAG